MTPPRFELTSQRQKVSRLPTDPPGQPAYNLQKSAVAVALQGLLFALRKDSLRGRVLPA